MHANIGRHILRKRVKCLSEIEQSLRYIMFNTERALRHFNKSVNKNFDSSHHQLPLYAKFEDSKELHYTCIGLQCRGCIW